MPAVVHIGPGNAPGCLLRLGRRTVISDRLRPGVQIGVLVWSLAQLPWAPGSTERNGRPGTGPDRPRPGRFTAGASPQFASCTQRNPMLLLCRSGDSPERYTALR